MTGFPGNIRVWVVQCHVTLLWQVYRRHTIRLLSPNILTSKISQQIEITEVNDQEYKITKKCY